MPDHVGPLDHLDNLGEAARLMQRAWTLVGSAFAEQQVREYGIALRESRRPRSRLHPWIPGLYWHRENVGRGHVAPLPPEVMYVLRDILGLERLGVLPQYEDEVARRICDLREAVLWEIRVASQYASSGITAEWSGLTDTASGAPDVRIPAFGAEIEVKWLLPREDIADDFRAIFGTLDDAWSQINTRAQRRGSGPRAIYVALPGATTLDHWKTASVFVDSMNERLNRTEYAIISAIVFATDPFSELREDGQQFYGGRAWHLTNRNATHPWPPELPLVTDE